MARVIKGGAGQKQPRRQVAKLRQSGGKKVIEKEVYRAQQQGAEILERAEAEKEALLAEAKQKAAQAREEAQAEGAQEAFEAAAGEALEAFRRRALRYGEAADDIRVLALEVARKILGTQLKLSPEAIDQTVAEGMAQLRARRKLRIQVPPARQQALLNERPQLLKRLHQEPDLLIEAAGDVSPGRARIVTEPGGALCSEQAALDSLAEALGIEERATAPAPQSAVIDLPSQEQAALRAPPMPTRGGQVWDADDSSEEEDEATDFLPSRPRRPVTGTEQVERNVHHVPTDRAQAGRTDQDSPPPRQRRSDSERERERARRKKKKLLKAKGDDIDRTMALEVSELRDELADLPSEELDLFADDVVLD